MYPLVVALTFACLGPYWNAIIVYRIWFRVFLLDTCLHLLLSACFLFVPQTDHLHSCKHFTNPFVFVSRFTAIRLSFLVPHYSSESLLDRRCLCFAASPIFCACTIVILSFGCIRKICVLISRPIYGGSYHWWNPLLLRNNCVCVLGHIGLPVTISSFSTPGLFALKICRAQLSQT